MRLQRLLIALMLGTGMLLALAPAAQAVSLYTESFSDGISADDSLLNDSSVGWSGNSTRLMDQAVRDGVAPPEGDTWYACKRVDGNSGRIAVLSNAGEYTLAAADRIETEFVVDWASSTANGIRFVANVDGIWYATDKHGVTPDDHGSFVDEQGVVGEWVADEAVSLEADTWYEWDSSWNEADLSSSPLTGLPDGDVTQFGLWWNNQNNSHNYAMDNFRISATAAADACVWDGTADSIWANGNWTTGGSSGQTPGADSPMIIDLAGADVEVTADFTASSIKLAPNAASALTVNNGVTLTSSGKFSIGGSGTLQVDGMITAPVISSAGALAISATGDLGNVEVLEITGGSVTSTAAWSANDMVVSGGSFALGGNLLTVANLAVLDDADLGSGQLAATESLTVIGSTLTLGNAAPVTTPVLGLYDGGDVALNGAASINTPKYSLKNTTTGLALTGATSEVIVGEDRSSDDAVKLTAADGANTYGGKTSIYRGALEVSPNGGNLGEGYIELNSNDEWNGPAALQSSGTINLKIGTGAVEPDGTRYVTWAGHGGFAAVDGPLTVNIARGDGTAAPLDWGSSTDGFNGKQLQLGSTTANDTMTLTSDIQLDRNRRIFTVDNRNSVTDVSAISGDISESAPGQGIEKRKRGVLWLAGNNTYTGTTSIHEGWHQDPSVLRAVSLTTGTFNLHPNSLIKFDPGKLETNGTLTRTIGNGHNPDGTGQIYWQGDGGFAAWGGNLTVNLVRGDGGSGPLNWADPDNGFNNRSLFVGSATANAVTTLTNDIDGDGGNRPVWAQDNPNFKGDAFVFAGQLTNFNGINIFGLNEDGNWISEHGCVAIGPTGSITTNDYIQLENHGYLRVDGVASPTNDLRVYAASKLGGSGRINMNAGKNTRINGDTFLAPGSDNVGTLSIHGDGAGSGEFEMNGTYEWEVGAEGASDTVAVVGGYLDVNDFRLEILDADGSVASAADKLDLFTWDADSVLEGLPNFDAGTGQLMNMTVANGKIDISNLDSAIWADVFAAPDNLGVYMEDYGDGSGHIYLTGLVGGATGLHWDGGVGNWADAMWGGAAPTANEDMVINASSDDSVVTVAADFITGGTGPAASVFAGEEYAGKLVVASGNTLEVTGETAAGEFGKIAIENGATLQTGTAVIEIDGRLIAGVQGSDKGLLDSAGQLTIEDADAIQVDWMPGTDAGSMFGGTYTIAQYSGTALATTGTTANEDANIGAAYIKSVDYAADLGGGVLGVNVELHAQGLGDTDLDGDVDGDDLATFGLAWAPSGTDKTWFDGDFDFDGDIDGDDLAALGLAWAPSGIDFPAGDLQVTAVPEPGTIAMLLIGMAGLLIYRKRR